MPRKADVTFVRSKGEKRTEVLFDSTAITANNLLAASLQGTLTSPSLPWFHLKLRDEKKFDTVEEMVFQMHQDKSEAIEFLRNM